jgi:uncharacterized protein DUF1566
MGKTSFTISAICAALLWVGTAHATPRFIDNGDGTISDTTTGLMWEKKTGSFHGGTNCFGPASCKDAHSVNNRYTWSDIGNTPDGSAFTQFLYALNQDVSKTGDNSLGCFANHCDWRLPEIEELEGIIDLNVPRCCSGIGLACIDPIFGPTVTGDYESATTESGSPTSAWFVNFCTGNSNPGSKRFDFYVRAVRGGP